MTIYQLYSWHSSAQDMVSAMMAITGEQMMQQIDANLQKAKQPPAQPAATAPPATGAAAAAGAGAAAQQQVPAPQGTDPTVTLNLGGVSVKVDYTYGPMNSSIYQGGADITATPSGCSSCSWGQVIGREGDQSQPTHKDGKEIGPLYGQEGGPANQLKDRPASFKGVSQTVTATSVLGGVSGHTFTPKGAMTWGYSINGKGGVSMIGPRVATPGEYSGAVTILRNASAGTGWQVQ
jgi:hypothetical protein